MKKVLLCFSLFVFPSSSSFQLLIVLFITMTTARESFHFALPGGNYGYLLVYTVESIPYVKFMRMTDPAIKHADAIQPIVVELLKLQRHELKTTTIFLLRDLASNPGPWAFGAAEIVSVRRGWVRVRGCSEIWNHNHGKMAELKTCCHSSVRGDVRRQTYEGNFRRGVRKQRSNVVDQAAHDDVAEERGLVPAGDDSFIPEVEVHSETSRENNIVESLKHFMEIHWEHLNSGYRPKGQDMSFMSAAKFGKTGPLSLHYGVFMSTLRSQTSDEQKEWWLGRAQRLGLIPVATLKQSLAMEVTLEVCKRQRP